MNWLWYIIVGSFEVEKRTVLKSIHIFAENYNAVIKENNDFFFFLFFLSTSHVYVFLGENAFTDYSLKLTFACTFYFVDTETEQ